MSTKIMEPSWMTVGATQTAPGTQINAMSTAASITSDQVKIDFTDNIGIHVKWTGTTSGTVAIQISSDPTLLGWITIPDAAYRSTPDQPAGSAGSNFFDLNQMAPAFIRMTYTRVSGTGTLFAKISYKAV